MAGSPLQHLAAVEEIRIGFQRPDGATGSTPVWVVQAGERRRHRHPAGPSRRQDLRAGQPVQPSWGPLHKGRITDGRVRCPWHLSTFSLQDGSILQGPATAQPCYQVRLQDGTIEVRDRR